MLQALLVNAGVNLLADLFKEGSEEIVENVSGMIKKHTGIEVDLSTENISDEQANKLRKFELEHEALLANLRLKTINATNAHELRLQEIAFRDTHSARLMQSKALSQNDVFSKRFVYYLAMFSVICGFTYIGAITFIEIPEANQRHADTILGVIIGGILMQIFNFFFGSSKGSKDKDAGLQSALKNFK